MNHERFFTILDYFISHTYSRTDSKNFHHQFKKMKKRR